jgi:hypothetical protein
VGIPAYGNNIHVRCCQTLISIALLLTEEGIAHHINFVKGISVISTVRNIFANLALFHTNPANQKPFSHLLMIDGDGSFDATAITDMIRTNRPIVVLPFTGKGIAYENIARAVKAGIPEDKLSEYNGQPCIIPVPTPTNEVNVTEPIEVLLHGTGAMLIRKEVLVGLMEQHPEWIYYPTLAEKNARDISVSHGIGVDFFHIGVNPETREYDSEDYSFVASARKAGYACYCLPGIRTVHSGNCDYICNVPSFLNLMAAAQRSS